MAFKRCEDYVSFPEAPLLHGQSTCMYIFKKISKLKEIAIKGDEKSLIAESGVRTLSRTPLLSDRVQANIWNRTDPEYRGAFLK